LKTKNILKKGNKGFSAQYRGKLYNFVKDEDKTAFLQNPSKYLSGNEALKAPPTRILFLGGLGAGKVNN
jgi:YHS domain-containing protein